jgi:hypothetical protein
VLIKKMQKHRRRVVAAKQSERKAHRLTAEEPMKEEQQLHEREDRDARRAGTLCETMVNKRRLFAELQRSLDEKKAHIQAILH